MPEPILTIGDLEPERPTVAIWHRVPDGRLERFKERYLDVLLRWWPVRYRRQRDLYAIRHPSEFGMAAIARIGKAQREIAELQQHETDEASLRRAARLLRDVAGDVLDAPADLLDRLSATEHIQVLSVFGVSAMGLTPTRPPAENPSTSADSSPASTVSTEPATG